MESRKVKQAALVIGGLFVLLVALCALAYSISRKPTAGDELDARAARTAITTWRELRSRGDFERVVVSGRCGLVNRGWADVLEFPGVPGVKEFETFEPGFDLTLSDGTHLQCVFPKMKREDFAAWASRYAPGTPVTLRGVYLGPGEPTLLTECVALSR